MNKSLTPPNPEEHVWNEPFKSIGDDGLIVVHFVDKNRFSHVKLEIPADRAVTKMWTEQEDIAPYFSSNVLWPPKAHFLRTFLQVSSPHGFKLKYGTGDVVL